MQAEKEESERRNPSAAATARESKRRVQRLQGRVWEKRRRINSQSKHRLGVTHLARKLEYTHCVSGKFSPNSGTRQEDEGIESSKMGRPYILEKTNRERHGPAAHLPA